MPRQRPTGRVPTVEVIVTQELDMWTAEVLHSRLDEALQLRPAELVVDLADCPYLDAAGIGMLLQVHRQARQRGAQLILRGPSPRLRRNLALARVDHVLQVTPPDPGTGPASDGHRDGRPDPATGVSTTSPPGATRSRPDRPRRW